MSGRSNRWRERYLCGILDQAIVNARILLLCKNKINNVQEKVTAIDCLDKIYKLLVKPHLQRRYNEIITLRKDIRIVIAAILQIDQPNSESIQRVEFDVRRRCDLCGTKNDRKTKTGCASCKRATCQEHSVVMCNYCCDIH